MADFTIADVLAWARTKPADERYRYGSITDCAMCQFLRHANIAFKYVGGTKWWPVGRDMEPLPDALRFALREPDYTFGGLVARLEALCPATPVTQAGWAAIDAYLTDIDAVSADKIAPAHIQPHTV